MADGFAREGLPLSAVHLDIDHMDGYRVFTADPVRFADLAGLCGDLGRRGTRVVDDRRPRRQGRRVLRGLPPGSRRRPVPAQTPTAARCWGWSGRGGPPSPTSPTRPPAEWWAGLLQGAARRRGVGGLARHERAHVHRPVGRPDPAPRHPARRRGPRGRPPPVPQRLRTPDGPGRLRGAGRRAPGPAPVAAVALGLGRAAALGLELDGRRRVDLGGAPPAGRHHDRPGALGRALHRLRHRRASAGPPAPSSSCAGWSWRSSCPSAAPTR